MWLETLNILTVSICIGAGYKLMPSDAGFKLGYVLYVPLKGMSAVADAALMVAEMYGMGPDLPVPTVELSGPE